MKFTTWFWKQRESDLHTYMQALFIAAKSEDIAQIREAVKAIEKSR